MITFRGDAHRFYLKIKKAIKNDQSLLKMKEIQEIKKIQYFYQQFTSDELHLIQYRMEKEKSGSGILPIIISSLPWLPFIFSKELHSLLLSGGSYIGLWIFILLYASFVVFGVILHYRENAWAAIHIKVIKDLIEEKP